MSTESELMEDELAQLRRQFEHCAQEIHPRSDFNAIIEGEIREASIKTKAGMIAAVADGAPAAFGDSSKHKRSGVWLAAAAALMVLSGSGLFLVSRDKAGSRPPVDQTPLQSVRSVIAAPTVHRLKQSHPGVWYFGFIEFLIPSTVGDTSRVAEAVVAQSRIVSVVDPDGAVWWVAAVEAPGTDSLRVTIARDGQPTSYWSSSPVSGNDGTDVPAELRDWAVESFNVSKLDDRLTTPLGWDAGPEQLATELMVDAAGIPVSVSVDGQTKDGADLTMSSLPIPEGLDPNEMPPWILLAAGVGSPERVVSEEGAVGWFEAASGVLHRGQGMTEPGVDGRLGMLSASGVDRSDIASTLAKLEDAGHSTSLVEYKR